MWRLSGHRCVRLLGQRRMLTSGANASNPELESASAHPILFNVPVMSRTVGRDAELLSLWQNLLSGRHIQAITGPDGIGKSSIAAEFCDRARRSERFTCIQWFDARGGSLPSELLQFFHSMRGRKEKDVLLVIDSVDDPHEALRHIPKHTNVYTLLTTSVPIESSTKVGTINVQSLSPDGVARFSHLTEVEESKTVADVLFALGYVPLLMHVALCLMESGSTSPEELKRELLAKGVDGNGTLSVSYAIGVLVEIALAGLETHMPGGIRVLVMTALFDIRGVSYAVVDRLVGDESGEAFVMQAARLGLCDQRWDEGSLTMHPSVAQILRTKADSTHVAECTKVLLSLWPRRWRGAGSSVANELARHTRAISEVSDARQIPLNNDLLVCLDRSATLLAFNEGKDLLTAAELWLRVVRANQNAERRDAEAVRIGRECGRLLHFLRDARAGDVLRYAFDLACAVRGKQSAEASLILGCYAPYLPASMDAVRMLQVGVASLENRMTSSDTVLGKEEGRMLQETIFVLLVRQGQMLQEMGETVPASVWAALQELEQRITASLSSAPQ
ncbi:putative NADH-ubiquinone oxidoreductase complex I subunit [Trypanosoma cruzi]|uniref:Uncharacterized protein n=2 Tax=Trypanosoma cruzi TaxID=5693 RepID=Q4DNV6_TRYCC|nr:hypothetical protein, conserved [Trypanosoma cruzi]EAN94211.1 hypothetical protein, conserved [Trypanosoma cruzi]PWV02121.1 putative NADH-ubiquinone oxidoreductase complex I subunit [Trypanosoma cruzi]|eukprot:XP_816062.1 hypothetical protein [Trypanosoma cruzi strain CL Brener]